MAAKRGLGRGLSALMEEMGSVTQGQDVRDSVLPVAMIDPNPDQPRRNFDATALAELADSVRTKGILQPILVKPASEGRYQIIAGERRWRACQLAGLHEIPVIIRDFSDADGFEAAIIENVQRSDLDPLEEAQGYQRLVNDFGHTQEMVAVATGKSRSHIANLLRLLDLPAAVQSLLSEGTISVGHAKAVLQASNPEELAQRIVAEGLNVRQAEDAARKSHENRSQTDRTLRKTSRDPDLEMLEDQLQDALGLAVSIKAKGNRGSVTLKFTDLDQLDAIIGRLQG